MYDKFGHECTSAIHGFHAVTGSAITGQISGAGKRGGLKMFVKVPPNIVAALVQLVSGDVETSEVVIERCK